MHLFHFFSHGKSGFHTHSHRSTPIQLPPSPFPLLHLNHLTLSPVGDEGFVQEEADEAGGISA